MQRGGYGKGSGKFGKSSDRHFSSKDWSDDRGGGDRGSASDWRDWPSSGRSAPSSAGASSDYNNRGDNAEQAASLAKIESSLSDLQKGFETALRTVGDKGNEKFDLIFGILTELQSKQADLENMVRQCQSQMGVTAQAGGAMSSSASTATPSEQQSADGSGGGNSASSSGAPQFMNGAAGQPMIMMNGPMAGFPGMMGDNGQMYTQQVMMMPSGNGMQYGGMMSPMGGMQFYPAANGAGGSAGAGGGSGSGADAQSSAPYTADGSGSGNMTEQGPWPAAQAEPAPAGAVPSGQAGSSST